MTEHEILCIATALIPFFVFILTSPLLLFVIAYTKHHDQIHAFCSKVGRTVCRIVKVCCKVCRDLPQAFRYHWERS